MIALESYGCCENKWRIQKFINKMLSEKFLLNLVKLQLVLILPVISDPNPIAEPKSFTDDPYVDDEKFREKG